MWTSVSPWIQANEIMFHKANLNRLMAFHSGQEGQCRLTLSNPH